MAEQDFLSFLVDETLKLQQTGECELSTLELKLTDYKLSFIKGEFIPLAQTLRFSTGFGILDIPVNWSVFNIDGSGDGSVILSEQNDEDCLYKVLRASWNPNFEKMLVTHADGFCYVIGLMAGEDVHLHDLLNPQEWLKAA